jgi:hypothetical protein
MVSVAVSYLHAAHPHGMIVSVKSLRGNARCPLEGKCCRGAFLYMLIKSVDDLIRAFVVAPCNHLVTVVTVENQHVNHPLSIFSSSRPNLEISF